MSDIAGRWYLLGIIIFVLVGGGPTLSLIGVLAGGNPADPFELIGGVGAAVGLAVVVPLGLRKVL